MTRYHLFTGAGYYPSSGLGDYVGPYEDPDAAVEEGKSRTAYDSRHPFSGDDWYSVVYEDYDSGRLVEYASGWKSSE